MDSEATFSLIVNSCGSGWLALALLLHPRAWHSARAGQIAPAARLAAVTAQCLLVIAMLTWVTGAAPGRSTAAVVLAASATQAGVIRMGVLAALAVLLTILMPTLAIGLRSRTTEKELIG